jgi:hypothetical protein
MVKPRKVWIVGVATAATALLFAAPLGLARIGGVDEGDSSRAFSPLQRQAELDASTRGDSVPLDPAAVSDSDGIPLSDFGLDAQDLQPQRIDHPTRSQLAPRGSAVAEFLASEYGPPIWYTPPPNPIFSAYELAFEYGPDRILRVEWIEDDDPALFHARLTLGYTLESPGGIETAVIRDFAGIQINVHPGDVWVRVSVDVASIPPSSRIEAAEADEIEESLFRQLPGLLAALGLKDS